MAVAKDLLKAHLLPAIVECIDWDTLQITNKSYVDAKLAQVHSDVVYSCQVNGKEAYIYTLVEQQSKPDPLLPFRIVQYDVSLMQDHLSQGNRLLPIIVNLCLYSGKQTPYPHSVDLL